MKPILFNTEMVRAIQDGRKTVTRRTIKDMDIINCWDYENDGTPIAYIEKETGDSYPPTFPCRYQTGDILYVRETWHIQSAKRFDALCKIEFAAGGPLSKIQFPGAASDNASRHEYDQFIQKWYRDGWCPSIHMPKAAARIFLRVTKVSAQPLQWCGNAQAKDEGFTCCAQFARLWDSTIKPADLPQYGWNANPWVWVIEFERCEKPEEESHDNR